jgi:hypothetical protein
MTAALCRICCRHDLVEDGGMSDPFLRDFWAAAPPPWNRLGPQFGASLRGEPIEVRPPRQLRRTPLWGAKIRAARERAGLRQVEVARALFMTGRQLWLYEHGLKGKGAHEWGWIAKFYGIELVGDGR